MENIFLKRVLIFWIVVLFASNVVTPVNSMDKHITKSNVLKNKSWIVDDEGDGDFIYIQDAVNIANSNDFIYVYSGNFTRLDIINKNNLKIFGIDHEFENGSDTGCPRIDGHKLGTVIYVSNSQNIEIDGFEIFNSSESTYDSGIYFLNCLYVKILNCRISDNYYGLFIEKSDHMEISNNAIINNNISGVPIISSINVQVWNNRLYGNGKNGLWIVYSHFCLIKDNDITNNEKGIYLIGSHDNNISENTISFNNLLGIWVTESSYKNTIYNNNISNNEEEGIFNINSDENTIKMNNISKNNDAGIYMKSSSNCNITENTITNNTWGVYAETSYMNMFYLNNFYENNKNALELIGLNLWDNGSIGNFWDDYKGLDENEDGIGDTPYIITPSLNIDRYPLFIPWDTKPPAEVKIIKPTPNGVYLLDILLFSRGDIVCPLIIGRITVQVKAKDNETGIKKVEFYIINDEEEFRSQDSTFPYKEVFEFNDIKFGYNKIKVIAYDYMGNSKSDEMWIFKFL